VSSRSRAGLVGGAAVGLAAAGGAAAAAVSTRSRHRRSLADPVAPELPATRVSTVAADDGVPLVVEEVGQSEAPLTVVLVHGFCLAMESWHFQRALLAERPGTRVVLYDQRGHGRSGTPRQASCTIEQLGRDLQEVLGAVVPRGPVVLVGHSMGGMTVMALARQRPDLFTSRVVGVGLFSTAADGLALGRLGLTARNPVVAGLRRLSRLRPSLLRLGRTPVDALISPLVRAMSYGDRHLSPAVAELSETMIADTAVRTIADFLPALSGHDEHAALPVLAGRPVLVLCGDGDRLTPLRQTRVIADEIGQADLVVAPGAGHLVQLEQPVLVNHALERLLERSVAASTAARA
jgi:pimeloyl-ACP methyl ester carboxylesterase